jgi:hypothetical protein
LLDANVLPGETIGFQQASGASVRQLAASA